jgi:hypothetical protein
MRSNHPQEPGPLKGGHLARWRRRTVWRCPLDVVAIRWTWIGLRPHEPDTSTLADALDRWRATAAGTRAGVGVGICAVCGG